MLATVSVAMLKIYIYHHAIFNILDLTVFWNTWMAWSECTVTCGGGVQVRVKLCEPRSNKTMSDSDKYLRSAHGFDIGKL